MRQVGGEKLGPQRAEQLAVEPAAILKTYFELRGMDVDVHHIRRHFQAQKADRKPAGEQQPSIGLGQRVPQRRSRMCRPLRNMYCMRAWARL